jgi:cation diffusion facilitator CzcD-associated flavoprotein CzcO
MTYTDNGLDEEWLTRKYDEERLKRQRSDGNAQFLVPSEHSRLANFVKDPFAPESLPRAPIERTTDVIIVGAGISGITCAARLAELGVSDVCLVESAAGIGGTWYWNRYPGVRCDTEAYIYMPMLEDTGYIPTEKYAPGAEIAAQLEKIAARWDLHQKIIVQTRVEKAVWSEDTALWALETDRGDTLKARLLILACGRLNRLKLPAIPGIERFQGHSFHTSRWDYDYTGGGPDGNLVNLRDKRVAIVGTGATGVQCIPLIAEDVRELFVIQRTPTAVDSRGNRPTDPEWAANLEPGWQQRRAENFEAVLAGLHPSENFVGDQWSGIWGLPKFTGDESPEEMAQILNTYDFDQMERIRQRVDTLVEDKETADALKPYYYRWCKRPTFNDEYLEAFNRPNVHLVDTNGKGADEITEQGIVVAGRTYEVDCIIYATGLEVGGSPARIGDLQVIGANGLSMTEAWDRMEDIHTLHGIHARGFPNFMNLGMMNEAGQSVNVAYCLTEQAKHIAWLANEFLTRGHKVYNVHQEAQDAWVQFTQQKARPVNDKCTPGYYNGEGVGAALLALVFGGTVMEYNDILADWRASGGVDRDFEVTDLGSSADAM